MRSTEANYNAVLMRSWWVNPGESPVEHHFQLIWLIHLCGTVSSLAGSQTDHKSSFLYHIKRNCCWFLMCECKNAAAFPSIWAVCFLSSFLLLLLLSLQNYSKESKTSQQRWGGESWRFRAPPEAAELSIYSSIKAPSRTKAKTNEKLRLRNLVFIKILFNLNKYIYKKKKTNSWNQSKRPKQVWMYMCAPVSST